MNTNTPLHGEVDGEREVICADFSSDFFVRVARFGFCFDTTLRLEHQPTINHQAAATCVCLFSPRADSQINLYPTEVRSPWG